MSKCKYHGDLPYKVRGCENCESEPPVAGSATGSAPTIPYDLLRAGYGHSTAERIINLLKLNGWEIIPAPKDPAQNAALCDPAHDGAGKSKTL